MTVKTFPLVYPKETSLFLLHTLCSLNFARYVLDKLLAPDNIWLLRAKYITLYYAIRSINQFADRSSIPAMKSLKVSESEPLLNGTFRSCMMHYAFINKGVYSIDDRHLDLNRPFWGLVESCFNEASYEYLCATVDHEIANLAEKLDTLLSINTNSFKPF